MSNTGRVITASLFLAGTAFAQAPPPDPARHEPTEESPSPSDDVPAVPRLVLRGFGNTDLAWRSDLERIGFNLGQLDVFMSSDVSSEFSVLAEVVLEASEDEDLVIDLERYQIKYAPSDRFSVALGRMHTALGYWNQTYHHGTWLQTTVARPEIYLFEDEGGALPIHEVGLRVAGAWPLPRLRLEYDASLSNGRGRTPREIQMFQDLDNSKAWQVWLAVAPTDLAGLKVGGVARFDRIPPHLEEPRRATTLDERVLGAFAVYIHNHAEILAEGLHLRHEAPQGETWRTWGLYVQGAWRLGRFKPYYRYDRLEHAEGDPFSEGTASDVRAHTAGLRIDPWAWAALKLELSHRDPRPGAPFTSAVAHVAFTF